MTGELRALTVMQPWSWAIVAGHKRLENRSWPTKYRGRLVIHAGMAYDTEGQEWIERVIGLRVPAYRLARGALVGEVEVTDCLADGEHGDDPWGEDFPGFKWVLVNPVIYPDPIFCRGAQGLWKPPCEPLTASVQ